MEKAVSLRKDQYVLLRDKSGELIRFKGPGLVFPGPQQHFEGREQEAFNVLKGQYVRLFDEKGGVRVLEGEQLVFPEALETSPKGEDGGVALVTNRHWLVGPVRWLGRLVDWFVGAEEG